MMKLKKVLFTIVFFILFHYSYSQQWTTFDNEDSLWTPPSGYAYVFGLFSEDSVLYVGGEFKYGGSTELNSVGKWNTSQWEALGGGTEVGGGGVRCFARYNNMLYVGGGFSDVENIPNTAHIARWDGTNWHGLDNSYGEVNHIVWDMVIYNNMLILGGTFHSIGTTPLNFLNIAAYNDTDYINIGSLPNEVHALAVYNGELYAGGMWYTLMKYNGSTWEDVGGHTSYYIQDMKVDTFNNFLYVAGGFNIVDDTILTDGVAIWNGFYWEKIGYGNGYGGACEAIELYRGDIYAGLAWDTIGSVYTGFLARWDGLDWHVAGDTVLWPVLALEVFNDELYVGGSFYLDSAGTAKGKLGRWYMPPDTTCKYIKPRVFALADTFYLSGGTADVQFYNNNAYVDSWQWDFGDTGTDTIQNPLHTYTDTGIYNVTVTVTHDSCVKTANKTITVLNSTGMSNFKPETLNFKLYPNPTEENFTVEVNIPENINSVIKIYGIKGELVKEYMLNNGSNRIVVHTSDWEKGIYICNLMIDGKVMKSEKMVVE